MEVTSAESCVIESHNLELRRYAARGRGNGLVVRKELNGWGRGENDIIVL